MSKWLIRLILLLAVCVVVGNITSNRGVEALVLLAIFIILLAIALIGTIMLFQYVSSSSKKAADHAAEEVPFNIKQTKLYSDHLENQKNRWLAKNFHRVFVPGLIIFTLAVYWKPWLLLSFLYAIPLWWMFSEIQYLFARLGRGRILVRLPKIPAQHQAWVSVVALFFIIDSTIFQRPQKGEKIGEVLLSDPFAPILLCLVLGFLCSMWREFKGPVLSEAGIFSSKLLPWQKIQAYEWTPQENYLVYRFVAASGRDTVRYLSIPSQEVETVKKLFQDSIDLNQADRPAPGLGYFKIACATLILGSLALATWDPLGIEQRVLLERQLRQQQREEKDRKEAEKKNTNTDAPNENTPAGLLKKIYALAQEEDYENLQKCIFPHSEQDLPDMMLQGIKEQKGQGDFAYSHKALKLLIDDHLDQLKPAASDVLEACMPNGDFGGDERIAKIAETRPQDITMFDFERVHMAIVKFEGEHKLLFWENLTNLSGENRTEEDPKPSDPSRKGG